MRCAQSNRCHPNNAEARRSAPGTNPLELQAYTPPQLNGRRQLCCSLGPNREDHQTDAVGRQTEILDQPTQRRNTATTTSSSIPNATFKPSSARQFPAVYRSGEVPRLLRPGDTQDRSVNYQQSAGLGPHALVGGLVTSDFGYLDVTHWHPVKKAGVGNVWSAVFLWSGYDSDANARPQVSHQDQTQLVYGRASAARWREALLNAPERLSMASVDQLYAEIDTHLRSRDTRDAAAHPMPASVATAYWTLLASLAAFATASLISLYSFTLTHSWIAWAMTITAETVTGIVVVKRTRAPRAITGSWLAGAAVVAAIALVALVISAR